MELEVWSLTRSAWFKARGIIVAISILTHVRTDFKGTQAKIYAYQSKDIWAKLPISSRSLSSDIMSGRR